MLLNQPSTLCDLSYLSLNGLTETREPRTPEPSNKGGPATRVPRTPGPATREPRTPEPSNKGATQTRQHYCDNNFEPEIKFKTASVILACNMFSPLFNFRTVSSACLLRDYDVVMARLLVALV